MTELETTCVTMRGGLDPKDLWRQGAFFQARGHLQVNAGRQQQAGKEDYTDYFTAMGRSKAFVLYADPSVQATSFRAARNFIVHSCDAFARVLFRSHGWGRQIFVERVELQERTLADFFLEPVRQLERRGHVDAALDVLYDRIDDQLKRKQFGVTDTLLRQAKVDLLSPDVILGILTATLPARSKLPSRAKFFAEAEASLKARGEWENGLLAGLES